MAGIGFSLKRLFSKKGIFNLCKAYGYAGIVTTGPMLLGVVLLLGVAFIGRIGGVSAFDRELLNCMLTYSLLVSLSVTSWFNMVVTRYVSDMLYEDHQEKVMPSFFGAVSMELVLCTLLYGTFLLLTEATVLQKLLCLWFSLVLVVVWTETIYLTAIQDYQSIILTFAICLMLGFLLALVLALMGLATLESLLFSMIVAYGLLAVRQLQLMLNYFPRSGGSYFSFLRWFDRHRPLSISGGMVNIGLFSHLVIMYFGPLRVQVQGLFYGAPEHDVPALIAFFSLLITTVSFVTSVEVNFYPKYSNYYGLFNDRGAIRDIELAEQEMLDVLRRELVYLGCKQLFTCVLFIVVGTAVLPTLVPGISSLSLSIFRFLCIGYGVYAIANSMMLMQLYFEDYIGAVLGTIAFAAVSTATTIWQILHDSTDHFGIGFFMGTICFFMIALVRLSWYTERLPYYLLSRQNLVPKAEKGPFAFLAGKLDDRYARQQQRKEKKLEKAADALLEEEGVKG